MVALYVVYYAGTMDDCVIGGPCFSPLGTALHLEGPGTFTLDGAGVEHGRGPSAIGMRVERLREAATTSDL